MRDRFLWLVVIACGAPAVAGCEPPACHASDPRAYVWIERVSQPDLMSLVFRGTCEIVAFTPEWLFQCDDGERKFPIALRVDANPTIELSVEPGAVVELAYSDSRGGFGGDPRLVMKRLNGELLLHLESLQLWASLPEEDSVAEVGPFVVRPAEHECGRRKDTCGEPTRVGLEFTSTEETVSVYDRQGLSTERWTYVMDIAVIQEKPECSDTPPNFYAFLVVSNR